MSSHTVTLYEILRTGHELFRRPLVMSRAADRRVGREGGSVIRDEQLAFR